MLMNNISRSTISISINWRILETGRQACGGLYFVCDHGKHRNAKRYKFGCNMSFLPSLFGQVRGGKEQIHPTSYRLSTKWYCFVLQKQGF